METAEEVLKNNLIGTVVDGSRPVSEKDWEEGKEVGAHVPFLKAMIEYSSLQNRSLVEENEILKTVLASSKVALQFMWDEMGKPHTPDHFNIPANAISNIDDILSALSYKEEKKNG